jgi:tellurite resistance protein TerA
VGILDRFKKDKAEAVQGMDGPVPGGPAPARPAPSAAPALDLGKKSGAISLSKGSRVTIEKTPVVVATASWDSDTDYDLYALVLLRDGRVLAVSTFGTDADPDGFTPDVLGGSVRHLGDVGRGVKGRATETIEITMTEEVEAVFPVAYSAQSNGTGSFRRYQVSLGIDNKAGTEVTIASENASDEDDVYSVVIGAIRNTIDGVEVEGLELYSRPGSEERPLVKPDGSVVMDAGPTNAYK